MDTLKSLMSTMADTITRQVAEQVKKVMEVTGSAQPIQDGEPSHRPEGRPAFRLMEQGREAVRSERSNRLSRGRQEGRGMEEPVVRSIQGKTVVSTAASTPYATHSRRTAWLEEHEQTSRPRGENSSRRCHSPEHYKRCDRTRSPPPRGTHEREPQRMDRSSLRASRRGVKRRSPSVVKDDRQLDAPIKVSGTGTRPAVLPFSTPFSAEVINAPRYGKIKMPTMDLYDGTTDPEEHLGVYKAQMYVQDVDDASYCRYFPATLKGVAQSWFNGLAPGSVTCFQDLTEKFVSQFIASRKERRTSIHLSKIKQGSQESLAEFVKRFHQEAVLIPDLEDGVAYTSFLNGLKNGRFKFSLAEQKETTLVEALRKAADFIRATEICTDSSDAPKKTKTLGDRDFNRGERNSAPRDRRPQPEAPDSRFTTDARSILMEIREHPMLRRPPPMTAPPRPQNARKYCEFHEQSGHTTIECRELKKALHELADKGQINQFLKRGPRFLRREQGRAPPPPQDKECSTEIVATIAGGYVEDMTRAAWKAQLRTARQVLTVEQGSCITAPTMVFGGKDAPRFASPHNDPLVVEMKVASAIVRRILVDTGSSVDIITWDCLKKLAHPGRNVIPMVNPILGFGGQEVHPLGTIRLPVRFGCKTKFKSLEIDFLVVDVPMAYNVILGRPTLHRVRAVVAPYLLQLQFETDDGGVGELRGDQRTARECYLVSIKPLLERTRECEAPGLHPAEKRAKAGPPALVPEALVIHSLTSSEPPRPRPEAADAVEHLTLEEGRPDRTVQLGRDIAANDRQSLASLLRSYKDVFAFGSEEMPGIAPTVMEHRLNADPRHKPVVQKKRHMGPERAAAANAEVQKLLEAGFIRECHYPEWISNVVLVKKPNGTWRMCVDFTDLNKACPKDSYPLPKIDKLVDATAGHALLSFMDAFSGYHQIPLCPEDQEKTAFITDRGLHCYKVMPFGLKNAGATYQRLVNRLFEPLIGQTMEVYVDDMIVKSKLEGDHNRDLQKTFEILRAFNMKLNPKKCVFGVRSGKFLGFMISNRGIEANPDKIQAILDMKPPRNVREVQRLTGCIAALGRFMSRSADKCQPFFRVLRRRNSFNWDKQADEAFQALKTYLAQLPKIASPAEGEVLVLYLAVSEHAVSAVLVAERAKEQIPVYYASHALAGAEMNYPLIEKFAYALVMASRKLRPYFEAHKILILTDQPLRNVLQKLDASGRLLKWAVELSRYDLAFEPRRAIKAQALADFIAESMTPVEKESQLQPWHLYVDGSSTKDGSGAGLIIESPAGTRYEHALKFMFKASNNEAEYEALVAGLELCYTAGADHVQAFSDSQLVVNQLNGTYEVKDDIMTAYVQRVREAMGLLKHFSITHIPRSENRQADALSKLASSSDDGKPKNIQWATLTHRSIDLHEVLWLDRSPTWMEPIRAYLADGTLPTDAKEAEKVKKRSNWFILYEGILYKRSFARPLLRCVTPADGQRILEELHQGICSSHAGGRALAVTTIRTGYYWPSIREDAMTLVRTCDKCQKFAPVQRAPSTIMTPIVSPLPFATWGMDILGPFPKATGQRKYLFVAVDYFTKWVEAEAVASITTAEVRKFIWRNIITRFGIPRSIIFDNGRQFDTSKLTDYLQDLGCQARFTAVAHPQTNGQAEAANKSILHGLQKKLDHAKGRWADELHGVLWNLRTTEKTATGETPFMLAYGSEAVLPIEVALHTHRLTSFQETLNNAALRETLDLLPSIRGDALIREALYKLRIARLHNRAVKLQPIQVGDLVLRRTAAVARANEHGKLTANWEGPYKVTAQIRPGTYRLETPQGTLIPRAWHSSNLRKYHI